MKKVLAIAMAIMIAAIVIIPALGYTGETAGDSSFSVTSGGEQSYSASSTGGQSYSMQTAGEVPNTAAVAGRAGYSISTGTAAHNLTPEMVTETKSLTAPIKGMRVPYSIKYQSASNYSIQKGSIVPYTIKQGSIVPYTIKQGSINPYTVKLMDVNNTVRDAYQKVKMEPKKLGSIVGREVVVPAPSVIVEETPVVEEVALNETAAINETAAVNETALTEEAALNKTVALNETMVYTIEGVVFEDLNGDGVRDANEDGLANWTVNLEQPEGVLIKSANTTADGKFAFLDQIPGVYTVKEILQPGWTLVAPAKGNLTVEIKNESVTNLEFANKRS